MVGELCYHLALTNHFHSTSIPLGPQPRCLGPCVCQPQRASPCSWPASVASWLSLPDGACPACSLSFPFMGKLLLLPQSSFSVISSVSLSWTSPRELTLFTVVPLRLLFTSLPTRGPHTQRLELTYPKTARQVKNMASALFPG